MTAAAADKLEQTEEVELQSGGIEAHGVERVRPFDWCIGRIMNNENLVCIHHFQDGGECNGG